MSTIPITEVVPRISRQLTLLGHELLDGHDDTARLAAGLAPDVRWEAHVGYLRDLQRLGGEALALASTGHGSWTARAASQSTPALGPVANYALIYEASDIRPGITIDEFRSQRAGNRHSSGLHAWLRRLLSRAQRWGSAPCKASRPTRSVAGATDEADLR